MSVAYLNTPYAKCVVGGLLARDAILENMNMTSRQLGLFDSVSWETAFASVEEPVDLGLWLDSLATYQLTIYNRTLRELAEQYKTRIAA